ncbi:hypothetical protein Ahy_B05g073913 [Arachis hypogaea]|uniref:Aminotransferase-like plant mobile domain-containing protein n=1 Tax=Arachis hypogaea TaxID=3818 RepID=A0A444YXE0_ARAHY|nr:hypothetical protein Ahy_B05g073913 [Arachis hypogaea]
MAHIATSAHELGDLRGSGSEVEPMHWRRPRNEYLFLEATKWVVKAANFQQVPFTHILTPHGTLVNVFMSDSDPTGHVRTTKFNIKLKWLKNRLQQMPLDLQDNALMQYAHCYILYLLGGVLLLDKANNMVHVRCLPLLVDYDAISTYSWDLGLALNRFDTVIQPAVVGKRSVSIGDTAGSVLRPYDATQMQGRRLSYAGVDANVDDDEGHDGHPCRDIRAPACGTGGRLGHDHH